MRAEDQQRRQQDRDQRRRLLQQLAADLGSSGPGSAWCSATAADRRRLFPTIEFASRVSHFDPASDHRDFRGFFNLFWIGLAIMAITTMLRNIKDTGLPLRVHTWELLTRNVWELALADFLMVASTAVSLPLHRSFRRAALADAEDRMRAEKKLGGDGDGKGRRRRARWRLTWARGGMVVQSLYQLAWLVLWILVPFARDWTWTAQVFLLLHTMVLLMKMHSYAFYNGHLSETERRLRALDDPATASRAPAYRYPATDTAAAVAASSAGATDTNGLHQGTPTSPEGGASEASEREGDPASRDSHSSTAAAKKKRRKNKTGSATTTAAAKGSNLAPSDVSVTDADQGTANSTESSTSTPGAATPDADEHDSDASVDEEAEVARLRAVLARELTSPLGNVTYPHNLTWANYADYLVCPTLCYELEYPRTPGPINVPSLLSKIAAIFGCIFLLYVTSEEFILPVLAESSRRLAPLDGRPRPTASETLLILAESVSWMLFPFMLDLLLVFLVIFEYVLGATAELTRFADRRFYGDWWNSTDWMEFSREWNVPVYSFLRRHVYGASRPFLGKSHATTVTFLISAVGHEIVMGCITKKVRGYGIVAQMLQLPIVVIQRTKWVRGRRTLNNVCFWCSIILGLSMVRPGFPY